MRVTSWLMNLDKKIEADSDDSDDGGLAFYSSFPLPERASAVLSDSDSGDD